MTLRKSAQRNTFQKNGYLHRMADLGKTPENDEEVKRVLETYESFDIIEDQREVDPEWQKNNLEYDLRSNNWVAEKCKDDVYSQHLYAVLCNNEFVKNDVWPILQDKRWSCGWRHAGGIVADIREQGDYIDWYCSGITGEEISPEEFDLLGDDQKMRYKIIKAYVPEGMVTDEIRKDLLKLGWKIVEDNSQE
jgi:hypothetical protein